MRASVINPLPRVHLLHELLPRVVCNVQRTEEGSLITPHAINFDATYAGWHTKFDFLDELTFDKELKVEITIRNVERKSNINSIVCRFQHE